MRSEPVASSVAVLADTVLQVGRSYGRARDIEPLQFRGSRILGVSVGEDVGRGQQYQKTLRHSRAWPSFTVVISHALH